MRTFPLFTITGVIMIVAGILAWGSPAPIVSANSFERTNAAADLRARSCFSGGVSTGRLVDLGAAERPEVAATIAKLKKDCGVPK